MGQQQLLLVILVTIIVGIATVVAINTFGSAADSANVDAVRQDLASIAAAAQGYYMKPEMLGGGSRSFGGLDFEGMAVPGEVDGTGLILTNENGTYTLTAPAATTGPTGPQTITVEAAPASDPTVTLTATIEPNNLGIS